MFFRTILAMVLLTLSAVLYKFFSFLGATIPNNTGNSYDYDLTKASDRRKLYNSKVFKAEKMTRPLEDWSFQLGIISHSGVRVTIEDGTKWLVHKGGKGTVVEDARPMCINWKIVEKKNVCGSKTVSDFVTAGGTDYQLIFDNCHIAAGRMMKD